MCAENLVKFGHPVSQICSHNTHTHTIWHVSSRSGEASCKLLYSVYFTLLTDRQTYRHSHHILHTIWAVSEFGATFRVFSYCLCKILRHILAQQHQFPTNTMKFRAYLAQFSRSNMGQREQMTDAETKTEGSNTVSVQA